MSETANERNLPSTREVMTPDEARRITERIRTNLGSFEETFCKLQALVAEAKEREADKALGFASWPEYISDTVGAVPVRLPRHQRKELVAYLSGEGLSTRAIAPIVGVSHDTVHKDLAPVRNLTPGTPDPEPADAAVESIPGELAPVRNLTPAPSDPEPADPATEVPETVPEPPRITGRDGKSYPAKPKKAAKPKPKESSRLGKKRVTLPEETQAVVNDLRRVAQQLERLTEHHRFPQNKANLAARHRSDIVRAEVSIERFLAQLPNPDPDATR